MWDGAYAGLQELLQNGVNPCRGIIVLTDGADNSSVHSPFEVITLANKNRIRVFMIGLGSGIQTEILRNIADLTGGRYYETPNPAQLTAIYQEIAMIILSGFQECVITYTATCEDGGFRKVGLSLVNFCSGQDTKTKTYKAPRDTTTFSPLHLRIGKGTVRGRDTVTVPIELLDPIDSAMFDAASFSIAFDMQCIQFVDVKTPPGSLLEGVPIDVTTGVDMITFTTTERKILAARNLPAMLAELRFVTSDPAGRDTVCCPVGFSGWAFQPGCFRPVLANGEICIVPRNPAVTCRVDAPRELSWIHPLKRYDPDPFSVAMVLDNHGDREARNARFKIEYDRKTLTLVDPASDTQPGTPRDVPPGGTSEARWDLRAARRLAGDSVNICIVAAFDNHDSVRCCARIWVPPSSAYFSWDLLTVPVIRVDTANSRYAPMPFDLRMAVRNISNAATDSVFARIVLPPDITLFGPDAPDQNTKRLVPPILAPGQSGGAQWALWCDSAVADRMHLVGVWVRSSNADSTYGELLVKIPRLRGPMVVPFIKASGPLSFCRGGHVMLDAGPGYATYAWNSWQMTRTIRVSSSGTFAVTVTDSIGRVAVSAPVTVLVHPLPAPVITRNGDTLRTQAATALQWLRDGNPIPGATQPVLLLQAIGRYTVVAVNEFGCVGTSAPFDVGTLPVAPPMQTRDWSLDVYPDPASGVISITARDAGGEAVVVTVLDASGRVVVPPCELGGAASRSAAFDIADQPSGVYVVIGRCRGATLTRKFVTLR
ncbi:MAG: VWA domain-containing protein [Ignavibacteria bacterium]|nr:VWA domain-containing protein [Ignavibacteria bacterium]